VAKAPITFKTKGSFTKTSAYLNKLKKTQILAILSRYGTQGVTALAEATPYDSGLAARSWYYTVGSQNNRYWLDFHNNDIEGGAPVVILIQYGHGTRNGGYVVGRDFINPAIAPIFDAIKNDVWKEVSKV
jgi:hypothetical protein